MKSKITIAALLLYSICQGLFAQPLVYPVENSGASCAPPPLPAFNQLPVIMPLTDPFMRSDNSGRSTNFSDWECRRNEIKREIENYEIGIKPPKPDSITASYAPTNATAGVLTVIVKRNGQTLTLTSNVALPAVAGPWPAIIGMNSATGSVPATVFTSRNIARITFSHNNVTTYGGPTLNDPFYRLYPEYNLVNTGQYAAWSWGVSRLIDGLELVQASLPINLQRIGVTGCSYAGKMALYSGALDERIALTIAQESGGGGAPAWRVSHNVEPNGTVEKIDNTDYRWFRDSMQQFAGDNVYKLPHDHHELMAMIAPRALLVTGNTDFTWLSNQAAYITARATKEIYTTLGIADRFGFYIDGGHNHCAIPNSQVPAVQAFVDKFLVGTTGVNTDTITVHPYPNVNYQRWYQWWGTGTPFLPPPPGRNVWLEAECATVGASWSTLSDTAASNGKYVSVNSGLSSTATPPTGDDAYMVMPFIVDSAGTYNIASRLYATAGEDYSYWVKLDNGAFQTISSLLLANGGFENGLTGWSVLNLNGATITANTVASEVCTGTGALKVVNPTAQPGNQWRVQLSSVTFPTTIGKQYVISYWVKAASPGGSIRLSSGPTSAQYQGDQAIGTSWQQVSWTITAGLSSTSFLFDMGQVANTYYIDDASVKEVGSGGGSWQWVQLRNAALTVGAHTLTIGYRDGNAKLDKVLVTTFSNVVTDKGGTATNCATVCNTALGNRLYVDTAATGGGNGATWGCAFKQLYDAIEYANNTTSITEIWIADGVYKPRDNGNRNENFNLQRNGLRIVGGFSGNETSESQSNIIANPTILSGDLGTAGNTADNAHHLFVLRNLRYSGQLLFKSLIMQGGNASDVGGVAYAAYVPDMFYDSCIIQNNYAPTGGAFYFDNSSARYQFCIFQNNSAVTGGVFYSFQSNVNFNRIFFIGNTASSAGGAYYGNLGSPVFKDVLFNRNTASDGGAVYQNQMNGTYLNCVLDSNSATLGGGIYLHNGSTARLVNGTFYGNTASNSGGAIYIGTGNPNVMAYNTIFWNNRRAGSTSIAGSDVGFLTAGTPVTMQFGMLQAGTSVPADNGTTIINNLRGISPMFRSQTNRIGPDGAWLTQDDGLQLTQPSPAVNSGNNAIIISSGLIQDPTDYARIMCGTVDGGAFELQTCATPTIEEETEATPAAVMAGIAIDRIGATGLIANPFTNELQVRYSGGDKATINIVNASGRIITSKAGVSSGVHRFDAANWGKGLYLVTITTANKNMITLKAIRL